MVSVAGKITKDGYYNETQESADTFWLSKLAFGLPAVLGQIYAMKTEASFEFQNVIATIYWHCACFK